MRLFTSGVNDLAVFELPPTLVPLTLSLLLILLPNLAFFAVSIMQSLTYLPCYLNLAISNGLDSFAVT
jgi:hypothetical protein